MSDDSSGQIDTVMHEARLFPPSAEFAGRAVVGSMQAYQELYDRSVRDPAGFWSEFAHQELHWFKPFDTVLERDNENVKWFVGGQTNVSYNCLDANIAAGRGDKTAIIWEGDDPNEDRKVTYRELHAEVCKLANVLKSRGVGVSRIARGVPVGGELEYVDAGTLAQALRERRPLAP